MQPLTAPVHARTFKSQFGKQLSGAALDAAVAAARELLEAGPRTRAELATLLAPRWPDVAPATLGLAATYHLPLVQVPPRGLWGESGQARWALTERYLDAPLDRGATVEGLLLRYLRAFGPASVADMRTWSTLTGLRAVVDRLRPQLRTFRDERGSELFDVPDGLLPDPDTPAPCASCRSTTTCCSPTRTARACCAARAPACRSRPAAGSATCSSTAASAPTGSSRRRR